jgi:hypothetical protein
MANVRVRPAPLPDELWLSRPPYQLIARVVEVEQADEYGDGAVSYVLYDEAGSVLEHVEAAPLDDSWFYAFQPLVKRQG